MNKKTSNKTRLAFKSFNKTKFLVFVTALILFITFTVIFAYLSYGFWNSEQLVKDNAFKLASAQAKSVGKKIDESMAKIVAKAEETANQLSNGKLSYEKILSYQEEQFKDASNLFGITIAFKPFMYKPERRLYAPFVLREGAGLKHLHIEDIYDYTIPYDEQKKSPNTNWYLLPLQKNNGIWLEPYFGTAAEKLIMDYSVPFYLFGAAHTPENQAGVVDYTVSLDNINRYIASMLLGDTSYAYIISEKGKILAHPVGLHIGTMAEKFAPGKKYDEFRDLKTGRDFWNFEEPLKTSNWIMRVILDQENFLLSPIIKVRHLSWMILFGVLSLIFLSAIIFRVYEGTEVRLWSVSIASSLLFLIGIGLIWYFFLYFIEPDPGTKIADKASLHRYLLLYGDVNKYKKETYLPTGVHIQSIYFPSQNRVGVSGYIWQKYSTGVKVEQPQSFVFQHQAGLTSIQEVSRSIEKSKTLVVWHFDTIVRQATNPADFPLEKENIGLRLAYGDISKNFVLVPDLESYETLNPLLLPGLSDNIFLEDWLIKKSFFSYKLHSHNSYFGLNPETISRKVPELYFNIAISRNILNSLFSYIIPMLLIISMLFAIVMTGKTTHIVSYAGAMLIVITVAHVSLRERIAVQGISYLESFYVVLYPTIVIVTITSLLKEAKKKFSILEFRNNLVTKLLFWPVILGVNFIIALIMLGLR